MFWIFAIHTCYLLFAGANRTRESPLVFGGTSKVRIWTLPRLQAIGLQAVRYDCSRISNFVLLHLLHTLDPDGLFTLAPYCFDGLESLRAYGVLSAPVRSVGRHAACYAVVVPMLL